MEVSNKSQFELDYSNYDFNQFTITIPEEPESYVNRKDCVEYANKIKNARSAVNECFKEAMNNYNLLIKASASIDEIIVKYNKLLDKLTECSTTMDTSKRNISSANKYINGAYDNKKNSNTKISKIKKNVEKQKVKIVFLHINIKNLKEDINTRIKNLDSCKEHNKDFEKKFSDAMEEINKIGISLGLPSKIE